jgi:hypothetical protein
VLAAADEGCLHLSPPISELLRLGLKADGAAVYGFAFEYLIEVIIGELSNNSICPLFDNTLTFEIAL